MLDANSIAGNLTTFAAMMAGISVAVERVVEVAKNAIPRLANPWPKDDKVRVAILQLLAALAGAVIASQMPNQVKSALPGALGAQLSWQVYAVLGLTASGGAAGWNNLLDILGAFKTQQETSAAAPQSGSPQSVAAPPGIPNGNVRPDTNEAGDLGTIR